jgi:DNA adenine methylase
LKVLKWPGSKWNIADRIIELMPKHKIYLEPFFGSGAVFFSKAPSNTEILNDLDGEITNLFKCVRDNPEELAQEVYFTPYSREEYKKSYSRSDSETDIEKARQFLARSNMARAGIQYYSSGWRHAGPVLDTICKQRVVGDWNKLSPNIIEAAARLKDAEIENMNAIDLIKKYSGPVMVSGYDSKLYNDLLHGWDKIEIKSNAEQGKKRVEIVWTNYEMPKQISLFG